VAIASILVLAPTFPGEVPVGGAAGYVCQSGGVRWGLAAIRAPQAWQITRGCGEIVVAVIDSGIQRLPGLADRLWRNPGEIPANQLDDDGNGFVDDVHGWDFRDCDPGPEQGTPIHGHGTFVAGLVAAALDAATGAGGVAPEVRIMDLRVLDPRGYFYPQDWWLLAQAIDYAVAQGARVINLSLFTRVSPPSCVRQALRRAAAAQVLVVGAAGNCRWEVTPLARLPEVVAVGAVDPHGRAPRFSGRGQEVMLAAPGVEVLSFSPDGRVVRGCGTSFAAPHVAGTAALILSLCPQLDREALLEFLLATAQDVAAPGWDPATGAGLVDASAGLSLAASRAATAAGPAENRLLTP